MDIITIAKDYFKCKNLQQFVNNRFFDTNRFIIPQEPDLEGSFKDWMKIVSKDGKTFFYWDELVDTIASVRREYLYNDIHKTDVVLDIGGCIGAYSLQIACDVGKVYVVEPVLHERIRKNIELTNRLNRSTPQNIINNVTIIEGALGENGKSIPIKFQGNESKTTCYSLTHLKQICGGRVDILKCDCEGGEWNIKQEELDGIRRIEMEVHTGISKEYHGGTSRCDNVDIIYSDDSKSYTDFIDMFQYAGFKCTHKILDKHTTLIHATRVV